MFDRMQAVEAARDEWENRKAAVIAFRAALVRKGEGPVSGSPALCQGVLRARRREMELSRAFLARLETEAAAAREALYRAEQNRETGVAEEF